MNNDTIDQLTNLRLESTEIEIRRTRRDFYSKLLEISHTNPDNDLEALGCLWNRALGGKWVWIWIFHPADGSHSTDRWELTSVSSEKDHPVPIPSNLSPREGRHTIAELARKLEEPVYVPNITNWSTSFDNVQYRVVCADDLAKNGCKSLICIPFKYPLNDEKNKTKESNSCQPLTGAICVHFTHPQEQGMEGRSSLKLMAQLSAKFIRDSYNHDQQQILSEMNALAVNYLVNQEHTRPEVNQRQYLEKVIEILCKKLRVQFASIFYRDANKNFVYCIGTNSLFDSRGKSLARWEALYRRATYKRGEGITGSVFESGKYYLSPIGSSPDRISYKYRETPHEVSESNLAWIIYPILAPSLSTQEKPEVLGVIRCVNTETRLIKGVSRNIDPLQISTLKLISDTLAPVLETSALSIRREERISVIKHDMSAPVQMATHLAQEAEESISKRRVLGTHFAYDLQFCVFAIEGLIDRLNQSPTKIDEIRTEKVQMESEIVAGVANMLESFARKENGMRIQHHNIRGVFPEWIMVDKLLITRCLVNLLINSIKYGAPESTIWIFAREDSEHLHLLVQNDVGITGVPVSDDEKERIFEEGYRSRSAKSKKIGLGLGLPIARKIMRLHDGDLQCKNATLKTTFWMTFPKKISVDE